MDINKISKILKQFSKGTIDFNTALKWLHNESLLSNLDGYTQSCELLRKKTKIINKKNMNYTELEIEHLKRVIELQERLIKSLNQEIEHLQEHTKTIIKMAMS